MKSLFLGIAVSISLLLPASTSFAKGDKSSLIPVLSILLHGSECSEENVSQCRDETACNSFGGFWFDSHRGCISNQGERSYVDNGDGTVTDLINGLMWQKNYGGVTHWSQAHSYCADLVLGAENQADWRLPTKDELKGLVICTNGTATPLQEYPSTVLNCDGTNIFDGMNPKELTANYQIPTIAPVFKGTAHFYWSSINSGTGFIAGVDFEYGSVMWSYFDGYGNTRCVR